MRIELQLGNERDKILQVLMGWHFVQFAFICFIVGYKLIIDIFDKYWSNSFLVAYATVNRLQDLGFKSC
jgi:hypothetical protein